MPNLRRIERQDGYDVWAGQGALLAVPTGGDISTWPHTEESRGVPLLAIARLFRKSEGAGFSGWIVSSGSLDTDPLDNRVIALAELRASAADWLADPPATIIPSSTD